MGESPRTECSTKELKWVEVRLGRRQQAGPAQSCPGVVLAWTAGWPRDAQGSKKGSGKEKY